MRKSLSISITQIHENSWEFSTYSGEWTHINIIIFVSENYFQIFLRLLKWSDLFTELSMWFTPVFDFLLQLQS